jgi:hypothetical protein
MTRSLLLGLSLMLLLAGDIVVSAKPADDPTTETEESGLIDIESISPSDDGLVRIEVPGMISSDIAARYAGDTLFIPYTTFCDLLRIKNSISPDHATLRGSLPSSGSFQISRANGSAVAGDKTIPFPPSAIRVVAGETYVQQSLLTSVLGISADYDPAALKLVIYADEKIPVVQFMRRQGRYGSLTIDPNAAPAPEVATISRQLFGAPVLNWQLSNSYNSGLSGSYVGSIRIGQQLLFGTLDLYGTAALATTNGGNRFSARMDGASWRYQIPGSSLLSQVALGTISMDQKQVQGVSLTNAPLAPREGFGHYNFQGQTQPGWTVELYDGSRLVDVTRADSTGRYGFDIAVGYGTVDRVTHEIGPDGEIIASEHRLQLNQQMLPAGVVEYNLDLGVDSLNANYTASGHGRVAMGLFDRVTIGADALYSTPKLAQWSPDSLSPKAFATAWLGGGTSISAGYGLRSNLLSGELYSILPSNASLRAGVDSLSFAKGIWAASATVAVPVWQLTLGGNGRYAKGEWGNEMSVEPQISGYVGGVNFIGSTRYSVAHPATFPGTEIEQPTRTSLTSDLRVMVAPMGGLLVTAEGRYDHGTHKCSDLNFSTYYRINDYLGINVGYDVPALDWKNGMVQAQFTLDLDALHFSTVAGYQEGRVSNNSFAQGSAVISSRGILTYNTPSVGESVVLVEAFHDRNGNGVRDDGEEWMAAPPARLTMGNSIFTSEDGEFHSLPANRSCTVELDRWSYASDNLFPTQAIFPVYTMPSGAYVIELPMAEGFDVTGTCRVQESESTLLVNGLRVKLIGRKNNSSYEGEIFSDGTIFVAGVSAGEYEIVFDADQLTSRGLTAPAINKITLSADNHHLPVIELGHVEDAFAK